MEVPCEDGVPFSRLRDVFGISDHYLAVCQAVGQNIEPRGLGIME